MEDFSLLKRVFKKYPILNVYVFGSRATGKITRFSDYDFGVQIIQGLSSEDIFELKINLGSDLTKILKKRVDIVIMNDKKTPILLNFNIIKDGHLIYSKSRKEKVALEISIMREWRDWQYYEELWSNIYNKKVAEGKI